MSGARASVRFGILSNSVGELVGKGLAVLGGILLAKMFAPEVLGRFFADQAMVLMGSGVYNLGVGQAYRLLAARQAEDRDVLLSAAMAVRCAAPILYGLVLLLAVVEGPVTWVTAIIVASTLALSLVELTQIDFVVRRRYFGAGVLGLLKGVVLFLPATVVMLGGASFASFVKIYGLAVGLVVGGSILSLVRSLRVPPTSVLVKLIRIAGPFVLAIAAFGFTNSFGLYWVGAKLSSHSAGEYGVAWKVYQVGLVLGMAASAIALPVFHELAAKGHSARLELERARVVGVSVWIVCSLAVIAVHVPEVVVTLLASSEYMGAAGLLPVVAVALVLRTASIPFENQMEAIRGNALRVGVLVCGASISALGVVLFVPKYGLAAVAWTACVTDLFILLGMMLGTRTEWRSWRGPHISTISPLALYFGTAALLRAVGLNPWVAFSVHLAAWICYGWIRMGLRQEILRIVAQDRRGAL